MPTDKMTTLIRLRAPNALKRRLKSLANKKGTKYAQEARRGLLAYIEEEEAALLKKVTPSPNGRKPQAA